MTVTFIGHGYVGLVTACVFADLGNKVWVVGRTPEKIEKLKLESLGVKIDHLTEEQKNIYLPGTKAPDPLPANFFRL